jgi:hypothetical protein
MILSRVIEHVRRQAPKITPRTAASAARTSAMRDWMFKALPPPQT